MFKKSFLIALAAGATMSASMAFALEPNRTLTKVTGDVYRFQNNRHYSLVTVTDAGVVVVDSINADAASWLKENLSQITDKPITHLIYSHSHLDHASGGAVLEAANVIAQANAPAEIDGVAPTMRFEEAAEVVVGDKTFELTYLGLGHGEDLITVIVRPENVAFITDVAAPKRLPFRTLPGSSPDGWIEQAKKADTLDFDIFAPAHGNLGTKEDLGDAIVYLESLRAQVLEGLKEGQTVAQLQASITMDPYKDWLGYGQWRAENVQGMAEHLIKIDAAK